MKAAPVTTRVSSALNTLGTPNPTPKQVQWGLSVLTGAARRDSLAFATTINAKPPKQMEAVTSNLRPHFLKVVVAARKIQQAIQSQPKNPQTHPIIEGFVAGLTRLS